MADEQQDPFTQGVETSSDDPFAGTDFGDFEQVDPDQAPPAEGTGELKTVDREGNEVDAAPSDEAQAESEAADPTAAGPAPVSDGPTEATPDPTPSSTPSSPATPASDSSEPGGTASAATESAPAAPEGDTPASTAAKAEGSAEQAGGDQGDPTPASPEPPSPADTSSSSSSESDEEDAPLPEEPKDKRGRATARRYIILRVDGPGKFTQVHWYEDDKGKMLTKREPGSRRQTVALCKTAEDALKLGYAACGGPQEGVNLVATAALHFQPKVVKPMPPEPLKQRLSIG